MKLMCEILIGDCIESMRGMPDNSVDSIVTDPPYGLSFMGKAWDKGVPGVEVWQEALRVLKPGGHLLAFAGTRTQHRMACAIEDAGFEIRDMIAWVYSTGFPKSHNFGCKCSGDTLPYSHEENLPREPKAERDLHPLQDSNVSPSLDIGEGRGEVLQPGVSQSGASIEGREQLSASKVRGGESSMEGRRDLLAETRELQANQVCSVSGGVSAYGSEGRLHNGASSDNGADNGALPIEDRSRASCEPRPAGQPAGESGVVPKQRGTQKRGVEADQACAKCGKLAKWQGFGTALKPSHEPITVARKPLCGTVAANVLEHGTGALNVDGCRVEPSGDISGWSKTGSKAGENRSMSGANYERNAKPDNALGRWPANLIHDGSEEVTALFPNSNGSGGQRTLKRSAKPEQKGWGMNKNESDEVALPDAGKGSAARFFYCAKASKADRGQGNNHPTVKPNDLMRYLVRLVTPPGGTVLDPFAGSGSTGKAALEEGFSVILCEIDEDMRQIITQRTNVTPGLGI
jgi:DNA modification methylase